MLHLKNIAKYYHEPGSVVQALDSINLSFSNNEFVVITGESGSGKSTLLNVISGLDTYEDGELLFMGQETAYFSKDDWETYRKNNIGFIFQHYNLIESFTVFQNIEMSSIIKGMDKEARKQRVNDLIKRVGLSGKENQKASPLSGGEKQRVAIARALAKDAPLIIADEPTGNLDKKTGEKILELLKEISKDRLVLLVSHSFESVKPYATRHIRLFDGEVTLDKELTKRPEETEVKHETPQDMTLKNLIGLAFRNIFATPKRSLFTLLISLFIVIVFAGVYGSYVQQAYSLNGGTMSGIPNATEQRIIVTREDNKAFTDDERTAFREMNHVITTIDYDIILDLRLNIPVSNGAQRGGFRASGHAQHAETLSRSRLNEGRLPESPYEVVLSGDDFEVGDRVKIDYSMRFEPELSVYMEEYTVVGLVDSRTAFSFEFYFHESFFDNPLSIANAFLNRSNLPLHYNDMTFDLNFYDFAVTDEVPEGHIWLRERAMAQLGINEADNQSLDARFTEPFSQELHTMNLTLSAAAEGPDEFISGKMHPDTFASIFASIPPYQMTLIVEDSFAAERVLSALEGEGYNTLYPARQADPFTDMLRIIMSIVFGGMALGVAFIMYFIGYISLKNVMSAKRKDYVILRSIGLMKKELNLVTMFEMLITMLIAVGVVLIALNLNAHVFNFLPDYLRYYQFGNYLFMVIVLLALSVFLALRFNKRLFDISVISAFKEQ